MRTGLHIRSIELNKESHYALGFRYNEVRLYKDS